MNYCQFCPVAKASEILGDKWTFLILRELLMGGRRFKDFQRGLSRISPTLLSTRLRQLQKQGIVVRKKISGQRGCEYNLTKAGEEVMPIIQALGSWGMKWARGQIEKEDLDVELLMLYLERSIRPDKLTGSETVIHFKFMDLDKFQDWWILIQNEDVDVCTIDPGKEINVWFITDLSTMVKVWMGDKTYDSAMKENKLKIVGPSRLIKNVSSWMVNSSFAKMSIGNSE